MSLKFFAKSTGKHLWHSVFLIKLQALSPVTLLKTDSNTGVFQWNCEWAPILKNFCEWLLLLHNNPPDTTENQPSFLLVNPFAPCAPLGGSQYRPTFGQQYLENGKSKHRLCDNIFKEYSTSFLMVLHLWFSSYWCLKFV